MVVFSWVAPVRVAALARAFLLGDGEAAAGGLLDEVLVDIGHDLLECGAVESLAQNRSPTHDVLSCLHLFGVAVQHLGLDFISQGFGFSLGFLDQGFQFLQGFDLRGDFDSIVQLDTVFICLFWELSPLTNAVLQIILNNRIGSGSRCAYRKTR